MLLHTRQSIGKKAQARDPVGFLESLKSGKQAQYASQDLQHLHMHGATAVLIKSATAPLF